MSADVFARYPPPMRVVCPLCGAQPAQPCRSRRRRIVEAHPQRVALVRTHPSRRERKEPQ